VKIKTQVIISLVVFFILDILIIFSVLSSDNQIYEIQKKQEIIDNIKKSSLELYYLENNYLLHNEKRSLIQWNSKYATLSGQLQELTVTDPFQEASLNSILESYTSLNKSFTNLVSVTGGIQGNELIGGSQELKEFYTSALAGQMQTLIFRSSELEQLVNDQALLVEERNTIIILLSIAGLIIFVLLNYFLINRSVIKSISEIERGTERIGSGDLDTKIDILNDDELGSLAIAFNEMMSSLKNSRNMLISSNVELEEQISERIGIEKELRESEERYRKFIDSITDIFFAMDVDMRYTYWNTRYEDMTGILARDAIGKTVFEIFSDTPEIRKLVTVYEEVIRTNQTRSFEDEQFLGGEYHFFESNVYPSVNGIAVLTKDITERKRTEDALKLARHKLTLLNSVTFQDIQTAAFSLSAYGNLMNTVAMDEKGKKYLEKQISVNKTIINSLNFAKNYQNIGEKTPVWQNVKMTLLYAISHMSLGDIYHDFETENLEIFADPLLEKAFQGLFENSVTHGEHVSKIRVYHVFTPDGVSIIYEDDGIGIPLEKKEQIFSLGKEPDARIRGLFFIQEILDLTSMKIKETGVPSKGVRFEIIVPNGVYRLNGSSN